MKMHLNVLLSVFFSFLAGCNSPANNSSDGDASVNMGDIPLGTFCFTVNSGTELCIPQPTATRTVQNGNVSFTVSGALAESDFGPSDTPFGAAGTIPDGASLPRDAQAPAVTLSAIGLCNWKNCPGNPYGPTGTDQIACTFDSDHPEYKAGSQDPKNVFINYPTLTMQVLLLSPNEVEATISGTFVEPDYGCIACGNRDCYTSAMYTQSAPFPMPLQPVALSGRLHVLF